MVQNIKDGFEIVLVIASWIFETWTFLGIEKMFSFFEPVIVFSVLLYEKLLVFLQVAKDNLFV